MESLFLIAQFFTNLNFYLVYLNDFLPRATLELCLKAKCAHQLETYNRWRKTASGRGWPLKDLKNQRTWHSKTTKHFS